MFKVHATGRAGQGDIQILCTAEETEPKWAGAKTATPNVYLAENDQLYTFDRELVTCPDCLAKEGI